MSDQAEAGRYYQVGDKRIPESEYLKNEADKAKAKEPAKPATPKEKS